MKPDEIRKLEAYLRKSLKTESIALRTMPKSSDSAEVYIGDEFVGLMQRDTEEGELSYHFTMTILDIDLD